VVLKAERLGTGVVSLGLSLRNFCPPNVSPPNPRSGVADTKGVEGAQGLCLGSVNSPQPSESQESMCKVLTIQVQVPHETLRVAWSKTRIHMSSNTSNSSEYVDWIHLAQDRTSGELL